MKTPYDTTRGAKPTSYEEGEFPSEYAATYGFALGGPTGLSVATTGSRVFFLRSSDSHDPQLSLWAYDVENCREQKLADANILLKGERETIPQLELWRRERRREPCKGIVEYSVDALGNLIAFALNGRLFVVDVGAASLSEVAVEGPVIDPQISSSGNLIAYTDGLGLHVVCRSGKTVLDLNSQCDGVWWGVTDHVGAEELGRQHGFWWGDDGRHFLVTRIDERRVKQIYVSDAEAPWKPPRTYRYPFAGGINADVGLFFGNVDGVPKRVHLPVSDGYLVSCTFTGATTGLITVQTRDQKTVYFYSMDFESGRYETAGILTDSNWVGIRKGVPCRLDDGRLVLAGPSDGWNRLWVNGVPVSPVGLEVGDVLKVAGKTVWFVGSREPSEVHVWRWRDEGITQVTSNPGVFRAYIGGETVVLAEATMSPLQEKFSVLSSEGNCYSLKSFAKPLPQGPKVRFLRVGDRKIEVGVVCPTTRSKRAPILMDPYGGGSQRVLKRASAWLVPQWFASQGFAVIVADGRGSHGRGSEWERWPSGDVGMTALEDQIAALYGVAEIVEGLDLDKVVIRGWSYGGYLAALAVSERPDIFKGAIVGAPVTDWRLYDTYVSERWLGDPRTKSDDYEQASVLRTADKIGRPILLEHGLADDNVLPANSLLLHERLVAAGKAPWFAALPGVTHMKTGSGADESLLRIELQFLHHILEI